jgi:redox-sensitive bicupin YhaK (pirin superfamily)
LDETEMIVLRLAADRGRTDHGWLQSRHTFSFGDYRDSRHVGFRRLRVINEDRLQPGRGFGTHQHRDMEILCYVLDGTLAHKDSTGKSSVLRQDEFQHMSAGRGVAHSEYNPSGVEVVHFLQIWILPDRSGIGPSYGQRTLPPARKRGRLALVAAPDGADGTLTIHQDVRVYVTLLETGESVRHILGRGRYAWVQVTRGTVALNEIGMSAGDGAALEHERDVTIRAEEPAEALLFDLA